MPSTTSPCGEDVCWHSTKTHGPAVARFSTRAADGERRRGFATTSDSAGTEQFGAKARSERRWLRECPTPQGLGGISEAELNQRLTARLSGLLCLATAVSVGAVSSVRITDVRLSPDGSRVVAIQTTGRDRVALVADLAKGHRTIVAGNFRPRERLDACDWVNDLRLVCSLFIFRDRAAFRKTMAAFGDERLRLVRLFAVNHDGDNPHALLDGSLRPAPKIGGVGPRGLDVPGADPEHTLVSRLPGGRAHVLVGASRRATPYASVYRVDVGDGAAELAVGWQPGILLWHADWQGRVRIGTGRYAYGNDNPWLKLDEPPRAPTAVGLPTLGSRPAGSPVRRLDVARLSSPIGPTEVVGPRILGFALDGRRVCYSARVDGADLRSVWEADAGTLEPVRELVADPERDVAATAIGGEGCGTVVFAHRRGIMWLDPAIGDAVAKVAEELRAEVVHVPSMSANCRRLVLASTDRTAMEFHLLDRDANTLRKLGGHRARGAASVRTVRRADRFPTRDGLEMPITLTLPHAAAVAALPIVVLLEYDGGWLSDPAILDDWPHVFASWGYAVAEPAFRGSQVYGVANHLAGLAQHGQKSKRMLRTQSRGWRRRASAKRNASALRVGAAADTWRWWPRSVTRRGIPPRRGSAWRRLRRWKYGARSVRRTTPWTPGCAARFRAETGCAGRPPTRCAWLRRTCPPPSRRKTLLCVRRWSVPRTRAFPCSSASEA